MKTLNARFPGRCISCSQAFPTGTPIVWRQGVGSTHVQCPPKVEAPKGCAEPKLFLEPIASFIRRAAERLKAPKVRSIAPDGKSELRLSLTGAQSKFPGSIAVKIGGLYIGRITPTGDASAAILADFALVGALISIAEDPAAAAKSYAQLFCRCSFCGLELTDEGSIMVGYGPICARNYDLPHVALGSKELGMAPLDAEQAELARAIYKGEGTAD